MTMKILQLLTHSTVVRTLGTDMQRYGEEIMEYNNHHLLPADIDKHFLLHSNRNKRALFDQFKNVKLSDVWNEAKSEKVVSYTIARDITQVRL